MGQIKNEQTVIDITQLNNYEVLEKIKKVQKELDEIKQEKETINNFEKNINYWIDQNKKLETKIYDSQKQIDKLKKQKINKIKNFFINFFSFGRKNKNKKISQLIEAEKTNSKLLKETSLNNEEKIKKVQKELAEIKQEKYPNLITNLNETLEKENKLLMELMNLEKVQQQKNIEVNEQIVNQYEAEILRLTEKICDLENQLATSTEENKLEQKTAVGEVKKEMVDQYEAEIFNLNEKICDLENQLTSPSSDEGFNSKSTSTSSLDSDSTIPLKPKPQISKAAPFKKSDKPWEQTLREYDYPSNSCKQKQRTSKVMK